MGSLDRGLNPEPNSRMCMCRVECRVRRYAGPYRVCRVPSQQEFGETRGAESGDAATTRERAHAAHSPTLKISRSLCSYHLEHEHRNGLLELSHGLSGTGEPGSYGIRVRAGSNVNTKTGKIRAVPTTAQLTAQTTRVSIYAPAGMWRLRTVSASAIRVLPREHDDECA